VQAEYAKAPQVTRERMYIDTMQEIYSNVTKVMVDQRASGNSLLYLPLDKLIQQVTPSSTPVVPSSNTVTNTPANTSTTTSTSPVVNTTPAPIERRDSPSGLRSRER
ncbi:MAG: FtsH protease modulator HflK, partial [Pseudomonadota bacterium]